MSTIAVTSHMVEHGAVITGDTGPDHFGLKVFYIWSNLTPQDFIRSCGLRDLVKRKGRVLGDRQILYYAYKLYGMLEAIGDWKTPKLLNAPRIMAKCNVYHFKRFPFALGLDSKNVNAAPLYFTIFPVARDNKIIQKIEQDVESLIQDLVPVLYILHGKLDIDRWNCMISEIESEFATKKTKNKETQECRRLCMSLSDKLREYFTKTRL
jgi:hypothetical protein